MKIIHIFFFAFLEMPFFYKIHSDKYKVENSHLMFYDFLNIFKFNTWTSKIDWSSNYNLENLKFLGKELPFPWHFSKFYSNFLRSPFLSSLGWHSHVAGNVLNPLCATSFAAESKHVFRSSEVIRLSYQLPET